MKVISKPITRRQRLWDNIYENKLVKNMPSLTDRTAYRLVTIALVLGLASLALDNSLFIAAAIILPVGLSALFLERQYEKWLKYIGEDLLKFSKSLGHWLSQHLPLARMGKQAGKLSDWYKKSFPWMSFQRFYLAMGILFLLGTIAAVAAGKMPQALLLMVWIAICFFNYIDATSKENSE